MARSRAFTLIQFLVCLAVLAVVAALAVVAFASVRRDTMQMYDASQVRRVHQGLALSNGSDDYTLPSRLDRNNFTLGPDAVKDLPRHILSMLIFDGLINPLDCVSVAESNPAIRPYRNYQFTSPSRAAAENKKLALWDPAFKATPLDADIGGNTEKVGNCSYAFNPPVGGRMAKWSNTFQATEAIVGNRGPAYTGGGIDPVRKGQPKTPWTLLPNAPTDTTPGGVGSNTLRIHGGKKTWEGNIAYNDNYVTFETEAALELRDFSGNLLAVDNLFANENDQTRVPEAETLKGDAGKNTNNFLRLWYDATVTDGKMSAIKPWYD